jgi:hypothetical protein
METTIAESQPIQAAQSSIRQPNYTKLLTLIAVFLGLILLINAYQMLVGFQQGQIAAERAANYQKRVADAHVILGEQSSVIAGLMNTYQSAAYGNSGIDRIAEQQLLASEYTLQALQIMATQNTQIIGLLSAQP